GEHMQRMRFADWKLDLTTRNLVSPKGVVVALSGAEFRLLKVFLERPNRVLNRDQLMELTQGQGAEALDRSIDVLVSRVRQRLEEDAREPRIIKTVRGEGYVLASAVVLE
ncbi:MAG: winged helix-turn-helix domain-containing protein, partial [Burkholderiales bacterium]